ncbi:MAG TPA: TonB family protein [Candidatus Dormibacteraeota bacterium]|nr:TonB family protein [Candidatus Dormibacteraeota bacterium]
MLFSSLPKWRAPWYEFVFSYGTQAVIIAIFVWIPILHPEILEAPKKDYHAIELVPTPVPVNHAPQRQLPKPVLVAKLDPIDPPASALRLPAPVPRPKPKVEDAPPPEVKVVTKKPDILPPSAAPVIPRVIKTNVFSTGSSAPQTIVRAPEKVQTGGFGDPNGVPARTTQTQAVNIAQAGGFDMPTGPGYGNGTGGAKGARGVVASTGFGNGVATGNARSSTPAGTVRQAGFGSADVPAPPTVQSRPAQPAAAKIVPAEILSKPTPIYTDEARAKRIEGEVLLEVVFEASGKLRVVRIVRGLGHGLDDSAVHAAEQIRFKPALRDGQPSDSTAVVHIIFQLA